MKKKTEAQLQYEPSASTHSHSFILSPGSVVSLLYRRGDEALSDKEYDKVCKGRSGITL